MKTRTRFVLFVVVAAVASMGSALSYQYYKGNARLQQGDFKGAVDALTTAIANDPSNFGAFLNRGLAYDKLKEYDKALADYDSAIELNGKFAAAYNNRGNVHFEAGDKTAACADRSKACELGYAPACKWTKANC